MIDLERAGGKQAGDPGAEPQGQRHRPGAVREADRQTVFTPEVASA
jgi:hypothetical protein